MTDSVELVRLDAVEAVIATTYAERLGFDHLGDVRPHELLYIICQDAKAISAALREGGHVR